MLFQWKVVMMEKESTKIIVNSQWTKHTPFSALDSNTLNSTKIQHSKPKYITSLRHFICVWNALRAITHTLYTQSNKKRIFHFWWSLLSKNIWIFHLVIHFVCATLSSHSLGFPRWVILSYLHNTIFHTVYNNGWTTQFYLHCGSYISRYNAYSFSFYVILFVCICCRKHPSSLI